jgi:Tol biopolymer transport system component
LANSKNYHEQQENRNISQTNTDAAYPKWSPDDSQIVYTEFGKDEIAKIYIMNVDGSNKQALVADGKVNKSPAWSPNGKTIAYTVHNNRKTHNMMRTLLMGALFTSLVTALSTGQADTDSRISAEIQAAVNNKARGHRP